MEKEIKRMLLLSFNVLTIFVWSVAALVCCFTLKVDFTAPFFISLLIGCSVACSMSAICAKLLTNKILRPFKKLNSNDSNLENEEIYHELRPFFARLVGDEYQLKTKDAQLYSDRHTIATITQNMKEGLVIIGTNKRILSLNPSGIKLLGIQAGSYIDRTYNKLSDDHNLLNCINTALSGGSDSCTIKIEHRYCRAYVNAIISEDEQLHGAVILLLDVTQREKNESLRREFSANVSHELKTPITSIHGYAELIACNMVEKPEDSVKFAQRILTESERLRCLVEDIIHLSRLDEGGKFNLQLCNMGQIVLENLDYLQPIANKSQVTLSQNGEEVAIMANASMMQELVGNLCENAIKYNKPVGSVTVTTSRENDNFVLTIADTGIGISSKEHSLIFQRFYRVDKSRSKKTGGTGLGLSIVKHIVELHNGSIKLISEPSVGSTIIVTLPIGDVESAGQST